MQFSDDQAASRIVLENGTVFTKCDQCRQTYAERIPPGTAPCESCRVELSEENENAAHIFQIVRGQIITRFNGETDVVIDLNHLAVWAAIDAYRVKDRTWTFEKILRLFHHLLREQKNSAGGEL